MLAQRYLHEYDREPDVLAQVAVATRRHAGRNPNATYRDPITIDDVFASPMISTPLHRLDCSLVSDGGAAYVVSAQGDEQGPVARDRASSAPARRSRTTTWATSRGATRRHDLVRTVVDIAGERAFAQAGLRRDEIDVAGIYDSFTITVLVQLEDLGFCGRGEAGDWIAEGNFDLGGSHAGQHPRRPAELRTPRRLQRDAPLHRGHPPAARRRRRRARCEGAETALVSTAERRRLQLLRLDPRPRQPTWRKDDDGSTASLAPAPRDHARLRGVLEVDARARHAAAEVQRLRQRSATTRARPATSAARCRTSGCRSAARARSTPTPSCTAPRATPSRTRRPSRSSS